MTAIDTEQRASTERLAGFRALSDPVRLAIIDELRAGLLCGRDLRERLQLSSPLLSHHLRVLLNAGLVHCRRIGRCLEVELDLDGFDRLEAALPKRAEAELEAIDAR
ncbi:MAG: metalloregulator ArsR/SmtB family transcription factor [Gaiellaceae bacterium]